MTNSSLLLIVLLNVFNDIRAASADILALPNEVAAYRWCSEREHQKEARFTCEVALELHFL
jgi:hypothetical protein